MLTGDDLARDRSKEMMHVNTLLLGQEAGLKDRLYFALGILLAWLSHGQES